MTTGSSSKMTPEVRSSHPPPNRTRFSQTEPLNEGSLSAMQQAAATPDAELVKDRVEVLWNRLSRDMKLIDDGSN
jgi:hypothetical protein